MNPALAFNDITVDIIAFLSKNKIEVSVLRLDKISPVISGNKWFKLRYYLEEAIHQKKKGIITFGGAWSNHIIAAAAASRMNGIKSIGIIRGEEPKGGTYTLDKARELGMQLVFIVRSAYQHKEIPSLPGIEEYYLINEGGYGVKGALGASTMLHFCPSSYTHYCCAVGTGTMMAGLINGISGNQQVTGISVMKKNMELEKMVNSLLVKKADDIESPNWQLIHDFHFGGYGKHQPELIEFMNEFYRQTKIESDFVYTAKLFYAITELLQKDFFPQGSKLLLIHSGGLQGNKSLKKGTLNF